MANTSNTSGTPSVPTKIETTRFEDLRKQVLRRAYELYELRGREDGHDLEDWLRAESELVPLGLKFELVAQGINLQHEPPAPLRATGRLLKHPSAH